MIQHRPAPDWVPCSDLGCDEPWCTHHRCHVIVCACPPLEEWFAAERNPFCACDECAKIVES